MSFSACRDCTHYKRGSGDGACLNCPRYKDVINSFPDRDTIRVVHVPQAIVEEVADMSSKDFSLLGSIRKLDPKEMAAALMRYYGRATIEETAEGLNVSPATVKRLTNKAVNSLKIIISEDKSTILTDLDLPF